MSTNVETWANLDQLGPVYPMPGTEVLLALIGIAIWIIWHLWQIAQEKREHREEMAKWGNKQGLRKVLELEEDPSSRHFKQ